MDRSIILGEVQCETARFYGGDDPGVIIYHQGRAVGICIGKSLFLEQPTEADMKWAVDTIDRLEKRHAREAMEDNTEGS